MTMPKSMALSMGKDVQNSPRDTLKIYSLFFFFPASKIEEWRCSTQLFTKSSQIFSSPKWISSNNLTSIWKINQWREIRKGKSPVPWRALEIAFRQIALNVFSLSEWLKCTTRRQREYTSWAFHVISTYKSQVMHNVSIKIFNFAV